MMLGAMPITNNVLGIYSECFFWSSSHWGPKHPQGQLNKQREKSLRLGSKLESLLLKATVLPTAPLVQFLSARVRVTGDSCI